MILLAIVAVASSARAPLKRDVAELLAKSEITTVLGPDGYNYPAPPRVDIDEPSNNVDVVEEPGCANGANLPFCCENGADNADCK